MGDNAITRLLSFDKADIERKKDVHKMALTKLDGAVMEFEIVQISAEQACNIQDMRAEFEQATGTIKTHSFAPAAATIIAGCPSVFHSTEVRKHYECVTFEDLVGLLLTKAEIEELADAIEKLSDVDTEAFDISNDTVKN